MLDGALKGIGIQIGSSHAKTDEARVSATVVETETHQPYQYQNPERP
jgi:hypothetical protein